MGWFKKAKQSVPVDTQKRDIPDGQWTKCEVCSEVIHSSQLSKNLFLCPKCENHFRIGSAEYISIILDKDSFKEINKRMYSPDPLNFTDTKKYRDRIRNTFKSTGLLDAIRTGTGKLNGKDVALGVMDFTFIGGSMGSVVGEKIARLIDVSYEKKIPLIIISKSGGARMMEAALSLMQMAKTSSRLARLADAKIPYISVMTNPTTGGTTASYAMLGDVNIAEPNALIGFAGPRVIKETIGKDLPEGFQRSEFLLEKGFLDFIVNRKELKNKLSLLIDYFLNS
ncbi:MAG: acetyl-CoA carboxylase carboxyltransferase subunit beta [Ignavibacteriales bacterium]|nr:acetyl-CoA carboxylase carboxyltransferase subunit beta [Ignavibacteriales bacterium]